MSKLKLGELFAGYGGLGMAVEEVFDAELTWYAEWDDAPSKIMAHHWPGITNYRDVTTVDWASVEPVDIISGGSPCPRPQCRRPTRWHDRRNPLKFVGIHARSNRNHQTNLRSLGERPWSILSQSNIS